MFHVTTCVHWSPLRCHESDNLVELQWNGSHNIHDAHGMEKVPQSSVFPTTRSTNTITRLSVVMRIRWCAVKVLRSFQWIGTKHLHLLCFTLCKIWQQQAALSLLWTMYHEDIYPFRASQLSWNMHTCSKRFVPKDFKCDARFQLC